MVSGIQLDISHLFTHNFNVNQFYLTRRLDPIRRYTSCIIFVFTICFMYIKLFFVQCSLSPIPFLLRDYKNLCCICGGNNIESNTRKIRTKTHSHAYPLK